MDINVAPQTRKLVKGKSKRKKRLGVGAGKMQTVAIVEKADSNEWVEISKTVGNKQKLTNKQIIQAAKLFTKIEKHYGFPCDIEWALTKKKFYITQSRPITTLKKVD